MERATVAVTVVGIVALVVAGFGGAYVFGVAPGGNGGAPPVNESTGQNGTQAFSFTVNETEKCGKQCREMSVTVANQQDEAAENVTLDFDVYAGSESVVWNGTEQVGTLESGETESLQLTITVDDEGYEQIVGNWGTVTLQTTVTGENATDEFEHERNVA